MSAVEVVVAGALTEDGRLVLDEKPDLPPGRVQVILRPTEPTRSADRTVYDVLEEIWAAQEARGEKGRPTAELLAELDAMRDEWDADPVQPAEQPAANRADHACTASEASR
ncbi:MAG: hypothetical protein FJX75_23445 [Armatimonadetes bacterium]|nr:hypothetical protein [Armatimonadota bacterium]